MGEQFKISNKTMSNFYRDANKTFEDDIDIFQKQFIRKVLEDKLDPTEDILNFKSTLSDETKKLVYQDNDDIPKTNTVYVKIKYDITEEESKLIFLVNRKIKVDFLTGEAKII